MLCEEKQKTTFGVLLELYFTKGQSYRYIKLMTEDFAILELCMEQYMKYIYIIITFPQI